MLLDLNKSLESIISNKIILYPTDTVWGLGCDATSEKAVDKIYQLKKRSESKSLVILVSSIHMLKKYVSVPKAVLQILKKVDNPTTIIYQNPKGLAKNVINKQDNSVAIRIVKHDFCRKLIKRFGKPIVSTSANISGELTPKSFSEISKPVLEGADYVVTLERDKVTEKSSTIIKVVGNKVAIIRA